VVIPDFDKVFHLFVFGSLARLAFYFNIIDVPI